MLKKIKLVRIGSHPFVIDAGINPAAILYFEASQKNQVGKTIVTRLADGEKTGIAVDETPAQFAADMGGGGFVELQRFDTMRRKEWSGPVWVLPTNVLGATPLENHVELTFVDGASLKVVNAKPLWANSETEPF